MRNRPTFCFCVLLVAAVLLATAGPSKAGILYNWNQPSGGDFDTASYWSPTGVPGPDDYADFDLGGNYEVYFESDAQSQDLYVMNDSVIFNMVGYHYDIGYQALVARSGDYGRLEVKNGNLSCDYYLIIGDWDSASGTVVLSNSSHWTVGGLTAVGYREDATGYLYIESGSSLHTYMLTVGGWDNVYGLVHVSGPGSSLDCQSEMDIGEYARGTMEIEDGATAHCGHAYVGWGYDTLQTRDPFGMVTVSGSGSRWTIDDYLYVGFGGLLGSEGGRLAISDGGSVECGFATLGYGSAARGAVSVSGAGSAWTCNDQLVIGRNGYGLLAISDGATVSTTSTSIAALAGSTGTATVSGSGSVWNEYFELDVGNADGTGSGSLTVSSNATLNVTEMLAVWGSSVLTIDGGTVNAQSVWVSGGQLDFRDGTLTVNGGAFDPGGEEGDVYFS
ncbi:MAG: hypothetical protein NTW96_23450, partial [Planctomycetia bacterium]|nr:hypothetical protein [Planctomycetia bacterium]